jgi:hypothetical protein
MELSGQLHAPAALSLVRKFPLLSGQDAGWAPEAVWVSWKREKSLAPSGNRSTAAQSVAYRYTACGIFSSKQITLMTDDNFNNTKN